ncbi:MAG: ATP-binding protein [Cellvibrio sp.]|uniref:ATP-binding protein n=1 Tax=Cellvibrio sp. TaxID=1965322 RepID=UPI00271E151C|nr:ATP-binding protein [Cellvibrio sp.]
MQRLTLSLLLVVISAVIGLGWGIDRWYSARFAAAEDPAFSAYKTLGTALALALDQQPGDLKSGLANIPLQPQLTSAENFPLPDDVKKQFIAGEPLLLESGDQLTLHFYLSSHQQILSLTLPEELHQDAQHSLRWLLTLLFYGGVILVVLVWLYPLLRRLSLLRKTAQAFGAGDLHLRIAPDAGSYIHSIELEFNRMAQRIEQLIADNKLLSRGLSHDLRTPLARLRFGLDVLQEEQLTTAQQQNLAHLNRDLTAMEALVEALLNYARLEQAVISFKPQALILADYIAHLHEDFYAGQVELRVDAEAMPVRVEVDPEYIAMLIHNLLQNALRYSTEEKKRSCVLLSLEWQAQGLVLAVEDNGPGIPAAEREKVLKPFYRSENGSSYRGHGLGLAIVVRIAEWHRASLILEESKGLGGLRASICLPIALLNDANR